MATPVALTKDEAKAVQAGSLNIKLPTSEMSEEYRMFFTGLVQAIENLTTEVNMQAALLKKAASV